MVSFLRSRLRQRSFRTPHSALRTPQRALADALDQLRLGVPLNWSQLEDDPELTTLSALQSAAAECRARYTQPPAQLRATLLAQLTAQLPALKPEPVKVAPKQPAGVSESVYIPPQAEENVQLTSPVLRWVGVGVAALLLIVWGATAFSGSMHGGLSFAWVEVRQADKTISKVARPANWQPLQCAATGAGGSEGRSFLTLIDPGQIDASAGQIADLLPYRVNSPVSYTLGLLNGAVSPCADTVPDSSDIGAILKLSYVSSFRKLGIDYDITPFTVFQFKSQPFPLDVGDGAWEAVSVGDWRGVYWRGDSYRDLEGTTWTDDVSVLAVERGALVMVAVGQNKQGVTKEMLLAVLKQMEQSRKSKAAQYAIRTV